MKKAAYTQLLTPAERAAGIRAGAMLVKQADFSVMDAPTSAAKFVAATALLTGIPMGIAAHLVGRHLNTTRLKERELKERIGYFRDATSNMERGLAQQAPLG
jgi:hypothetical protein